MSKQLVMELSTSLYSLDKRRFQRSATIPAPSLSIKLIYCGLRGDIIEHDSTAGRQTVKKQIKRRYNFSVRVSQSNQIKSAKMFPPIRLISRKENGTQN